MALHDLLNETVLRGAVQVSGPPIERGIRRFGAFIVRYAFCFGFCRIDPNSSIALLAGVIVPAVFAILAAKLLVSFQQ